MAVPSTQPVARHVAAPAIADYARLIREVGRGPHGARDLDAATAQRLFGAMLDGDVPPLELGALLVAYRIKGESVSELSGFVDAAMQRLARLEPPRGGARPIVLPTYNGARRLPNLTPLFALLLCRRHGMSVLLHGPAAGDEAFGRVTTSDVLRALGIAACTTPAQAQWRLETDGVAYAPIDALAPGLAALLALRRRTGLRSSAHTVAKLVDPFHGAGLRIVAVSHPGYVERLRDYLSSSGGEALLMRGTEGEPFAHPRRRPRLEWLRGGASTSLCDAQEGSLQTLPELPPAIDAASTAQWIREALLGAHPVPQPLLDHVDGIVQAARATPCR